MLSRARVRWLLVGVLLLAAAMRLYGLSRLSPPGPAHDEVANWLIDRSLLAGNHAIYFTEAYGHEAGFHYLQALFLALLGDHLLALRLPAAFAGLLGVALTYALGRQLFGRWVGLLAAALLAVLFWPVFFSRLALRAILLPLISGISAYLWWRAWTRSATPHPQSQIANLHSPLLFAAAGLFAGLSLYTYMAARTVPIFYLLFILYLLLFQRPALRQRWRGVLLFWFLFLLVATPLTLYLLGNPGAEFRVGEIDAPLRALRAGHLQPAVDNLVDIVGMFGFRGDPLWRQNVASAPVFDPLTAGFFYACLLLFLLRVRNSRYAFLFLWVLTAFIPSIVTIDAPSSIRIINILPVLTILPAIIMHRFATLSTEKWHLSTGGVENLLLFGLLFALSALHFGRTARAIFVTWPAQEEVTFVWQEALTDAAAYLDQVPAAEVAIGGWSPATMDAPTMALTLRREDLDLRFFNPQEAFLIPSGPLTTVPARVLRPTILPLSPALARAVDNLGITAEEHGTFAEYLFPTLPTVQPDLPADVTFADELLFLGHSFSIDCHPDIFLPCQLLTYWRVLSPPATPRRFFLHVLDEEGQLVTTGDGLGAPARYWQTGDILIQQHELAVDAIAPYSLRLGVYNPQNGRRLPTASGSDHVLLAQE